MPEATIVQLGALGVILLFTIKELFAYLKSRQGGDYNGHVANDKAILRELQSMNNNHLNSLKEAIEQGNHNLIETIHNDNTRIIEALGEIKGRLSK